MINQTSTKKSKVLLALLAVVFLCSQSILTTYAQGTEVRVVPDTLTVGVEGEPIPTEPFTINVTATNVTNMNSWQVCIWYDPLVVNFSAAWLPSDHVFAGLPIVEVEPDVATTAKGTYLFYGCLLQYSASVTFDDTRTLCQINFTAVARGVTVLNISRPIEIGIPFDTSLDDPDFNDIEKTTYDGSVTVIPEFPILSILLVAFVVSGVTMVLLKKRWLQKLPTYQKV